VPSSAERPTQASLSGTIIGGKYRIVSELGRGGMGSVWRAEHLAWAAPVAIKLMNPEIADQPEARLRFEREVRLAAGLRSPHVVQVLDHGIDEATRQPFIAMELLEGESLDHRLKRLSRLSPPETFHIVSHIVRALSRAHEAGIVHRDLKPDNVFLVRNDEEIIAKILDFGVAKGHGAQLSDGLTRPGRVLGTPYYMSPEQLRGAEIDQRADLWSLSTIVCECLTGRRPFQASDFAELSLLLLGNVGRPLPSSLGPVPPGFDAWFVHATQPNIAQRFQSARELGQALAPICGGTSSGGMEVAYNTTEEMSGERERASMPAFAHTQLGSVPRWRNALRIASPTLLALVVVGGGLAYWHSQQVVTQPAPSQMSAVDPLLPARTPGVPKTGAVAPPAGGTPGVRPMLEPNGSIQRPLSPTAGAAEANTGVPTGERPQVRPVAVDDSAPEATASHSRYSTRDREEPDSREADELPPVGRKPRSATRGRRSAGSVAAQRMAAERVAAQRMAAERGPSGAENAAQKLKKVSPDEQTPATPSPAPHSSSSPGVKVNDHAIRTSL
jgi:serine/threonine protein kinase